jgi:hypothetical protein
MQLTLNDDLWGQLVKIMKLHNHARSGKKNRQHRRG